MANIGSGLQAIHTSSLTDSPTTAAARLGSIRVEYDETYGEKWYMYVLFSTVAASGQVVVWTGTTGYTVGVSTTAAHAGKKPAVGVALATMAASDYGWIQVRGHKTSIRTGPTTGFCTSAYAECYLTSGGVFSFRKCTAQSTTACTNFIPAGITAFSKVNSASSCSGYIHCF
jgi:hypothetical protein